MRKVTIVLPEELDTELRERVEAEYDSKKEGLSIQMSDPVKDFEYARNAVTLTFDLYGRGGVRLAFEAMEFGDEPHAPPPGPLIPRLVAGRSLSRLLYSKPLVPHIP